jgi:hypothetical protein
MTVRVDPLALGEVRVVEKISPAVTVKVAGVPRVLPLPSRNEMVPLHAAAVPLEDAVATFATLTCAVSLPANPTGGKECGGGVVVLLFAP